MSIGKERDGNKPRPVDSGAAYRGAHLARALMKAHGQMQRALGVALREMRHLRATIERMDPATDAQWSSVMHLENCTSFAGREMEAAGAAASRMAAAARLIDDLLRPSPPATWRDILPRDKPA